MNQSQKQTTTKPVKVYHCECCNYTTKDRSHFAKHLKCDKHIMKQRQAQYDAEEKTNKCKVCKKEFDTYDACLMRQYKHKDIEVLKMDIYRLKGLIGLCLKYLPGGRYAPHHLDKRKYREEVKEQKKYKKLYAVKSKAYKRLKRHYNKLVNKEEDPVKKIVKRKAKAK